MAVLVLGRAVQGLGAGVVIVLLYVIAGQAYSSELRPRLFGAFAAGWVLPALIGPLAAGLVTTHLGWRGVFLRLLPLVGAGLALLLSAGSDGRARGAARCRPAQQRALGPARRARASPPCSTPPSGSTSPPSASPWWAPWRWRPACAGCSRAAPSAPARASRRSSRAADCWPAPSSAWTRCCRSS